MKESDIQGLASQDGPESCAGSRKTASKALTGVHMGGVLSRENKCNQGADAVVQSGRPYADGRNGELISNPARSETSSRCGNSMRENREIPYQPLGDGTGGPAGKVIDRNPAMHGYGKSDSPTVLTKPSNKAEDSVAEVVEGRGLTKENTDQQNTSQTQCRTADVPSTLDRVRQVAVRNKEERFSALLHHVTIERLRAAFLAVKRNASPGVDGVTWGHYEADLERNLGDLYTRVQCGPRGRSVIA